MPVTTQPAAQQPEEQNLDFRAALLGETPDGVTIEEAERVAEENEKNIGDDGIDHSVLVVGSEKELENQRQQFQAELEEHNQEQGFDRNPGQRTELKQNKGQELEGQNKEKAPKAQENAKSATQKKDQKQKKNEKTEGAEATQQQTQGWKDFVIEKGFELKDTVRHTVREKGIMGATFEFKDVAFDKGSQLKDIALEKTVHLKDVALGMGTDLKDSVQQKGLIKTGVELGTAAFDKTAHLREVALDKGVELTDAALQKTGLTGLKDTARGVLEKGVELKDSVREKGVIRTATTAGFELKDAAVGKSVELKNAAVHAVFGASQQTKEQQQSSGKDQNKDESSSSSSTEKTEIRQRGEKLKDAVFDVKDAAMGLKDAVLERGIIGTTFEIKDMAVDATVYVKDAVLEKGVHLKDAGVGFATHKVGQLQGAASGIVHSMVDTLQNVREAVMGIHDEDGDAFRYSHEQK